MAVRRRGFVGSALATVLLGTFLYRAGPTLGPASGAESNQSGKALSTVIEPAKKGSTKPTSSTKGQKNATQTVEGPWLASQKHFAGRGPCRYAASNPQSWCIAPEPKRLKGKAHDEMAMIAIVPDPVQTHLALRFDRAIDAIELAAESMNYVPDRYWLPWDLDPKSDWVDYESVKKAKKDRVDKESEPGLLMFRWDAKPQDAGAIVIYVFLVGETPTAGVNTEQFVKAVCYADQVTEIGLGRKPNPCNPHSRKNVFNTYVLGPTSSGSFASLAELIEDYPPKKFVINTTARNSLAIEAITDDLGQFSMFVRPVAEAKRTLENLLLDDQAIDQGSCHEQGKHEVAIMSEASTSLGESAGQSLGASGSDSCVDVFRYPREIASLRNAYSVTNAQNPMARGKTASPRPSLSVNLTDTTDRTDTANRRDEPPDFSKAQSPLSQEATLMDFAAEMQRKHYRYIGINSSNPLDVVFLVSFLRSAVPNARLFSFDSDLLLEHEPDNIPYVGTLSVTTYPLLYSPLNEIGNQTGAVNTLGMDTHLPFTSQREEGLYNAAICTVREMLDQANLGFLLEREDYPEREVCRRTPNQPFWLTVFGAGGHWPIQMLGPQEELRKVPSPDLKNLPLPFFWEAVCTLLLALEGLHVLVLLGLAPFSPKFQEFKLGTVAPARQLFGIHAVSATLALALFLVASSAWRPNPWTCVALGSGWILPLTCWLLTVKYWRWQRAGRNNPPEQLSSPSLFPLQIFFAIWVAAGGLAYMWWTLLHDLDGYYGDFFRFRAANMASIVSPLTPMLPLLAAIYIGSIFYVWHLLFNDKIRPRLNPSREERSGEDQLRPGWRSEKFIASAVNEDVQSGLIGCLILALWVMVFRQPPQFELFERSQFQILFEILFGLVILLILVSGFRLARIWQTLQRFLLEVDRQRARCVFLQLKGDGFSWASIWFYGSQDPDWDYMVKSLEVLQQLWKTPDHPLGSGAVDAAIKEIRRTRRKLQDEGRFAFHPFRIAESDGKLDDAISRAQDLLAATLNHVLDRLLVIWGDPPSTPEGIERQKLLEKYVALRWAAFIRAVIARIRLLIIFLAISFSLAMISLVIYSFEPHRELLWSVTALFIAIGLLIIKVLIQMHRDSTLSGITVTKPGRLDPSFYVQIVTLGVGPLVTLLATYLPSIGRYVLSFLQPGLEALK